MSDLALATSTFYPSLDDTRFALALKTAAEAGSYGYNLVVVDDSPPDVHHALAGELTDHGATVLKQEGIGAMGIGRREAMAKAAELATNVCWLEPEKWPLVGQLGVALEPLLTGEADCVIPARRSLGSYPPEQQFAEDLGNLAFEYITGHKLDIWFGPMLLTPTSLPYVLNYRAGDYGLPDLWDSILVPRIPMLADGLRVVSQFVSYSHPAAQTAAETGDMEMVSKRIIQLLTLVEGFRRAAEHHGRAAQPA